MQQIKIFKSIETEVSSLESEINSWLQESGAKVINIFGNIAPQTVNSDSSGTGGSRVFSPSDVFTVVVYEKQRSYGKHRSRQRYLQPGQFQLFFTSQS